ncbi:DUF3055 domain-containing protein [Evansella clarkii]|jgi:hypothetical protein|uniref:DUF3055 domain-containing protein n=1 Tax=Evansella clarkii TaxID=79879 RepID=UPI000998A5F8|nr:DUF3055 domain-containing protein [Evansella clarkii]
MESYELLYDKTERVNVNFVGMTTESARYDFGITYTNMFFGKPLITCMQTGRSFLLCADDITDVEQIERLFKVDPYEAEALAEFFKDVLPVTGLQTQYAE